MNRTYQAGDRVHVYETASLAAAVEAGHAIGGNGGAPRPATIVREHPSEPGVYEVAYSDEAGGGDLITDGQRIRPAAND